MENLEKILQENFGLEIFHEGQREIIENVLNKNDTLVFMPTGGGKSLTYQMPGVILDGLTIVISPLISLMKDQIDKLNLLGIRSEFINSTISTSDQHIVLNELIHTDFKEKNAIKFLYIAPERLNSQEFIKNIQNIKISLVAIDEAHCISQWGHDFRPSYMKIKDFLENLKKHEQKFPIMALTATATKKVRQDIVDRLGLTDYKIFTKGFDRKNIIILVREISKMEDKLDKTLEIIEKTPGSGIIYCSSRKMVDDVYNFLLVNDISVGKYTGAMTKESRENTQNKFMSSEYKVIVATNAFGMGIDKKDIRFVIHYNLPGSIENYYQEVGRAGRDGKKSFGVVLASYGDTKIQEFFIENIYPKKKEVLDIYDYLFKDFALGEGNNAQIMKTYNVIAKESGVGNDMKVGNILKLLEKYGIINKGFEGDIEGFRGKGITLTQEKRKLSGILIDWKKQSLLEEESYFKLEQIKRLLFYPACRKRFILEYFGDEEDLVTLESNCRACDYCLEKDKVGSGGELINLVNLSVFEIVLDTVKKFDKKFGVNTIALFLEGSNDKKLIEWGLSKYEEYGILKEYSTKLVVSVIESLIRYGFIEKTSGMYPIIGLTDKGKVSIIKEYLLKNEEKDLQSFLAIKAKDDVFSKSKSHIGKRTINKGSTGNISAESTYNETYKLFKDGLDINKIAKTRQMATTTIEGHLIKLYADGKLDKDDILKFADIDNIEKIKQVIKIYFPSQIEKLKPIKDKIDEQGFNKISYFEIKVCIAINFKGD